MIEVSDLHVGVATPPELQSAGTSAALSQFDLPSTYHSGDWETQPTLSVIKEHGDSMSAFFGPNCQGFRLITQIAWFCFTCPINCRKDVRETTPIQEMLELATM